MSRVSRRHFLQAAGSTLAAIGLSQLDFLHQSDRYGQVLAQSTPRKLALLVGINNYTTANPLRGCLTDVELQRELLIHRYGFQPSDIVEVWDNASSDDLKPTRTNILRAFQEHLIAQAQPGDVVVFHYSGHGSRVTDLTPLDSEACQKNEACHLNGTLVPSDPVDYGDSDSTVTVKDIMGRSLFLLTQQINTDNVTMVLDSCYSGAGTRGNTVVRAVRRDLDHAFIPSPEEIAFQQEQLTNLRWSQQEFEDARQCGIAKGIALGSAQRNQLALDNRFDGFHAGAFTYLLTRYLWQSSGNESARSTYVNLARSTRSLAEAQHYIQEPIMDVAPNTHGEECNINTEDPSLDDVHPLYFAAPSTPTAEAVITNITGENVSVWLGGVSWRNIGSNSTVFTVLDKDGDIITVDNGDPLEVQQQSRTELTAIAQVVNGDISQLREGQLLREKIVGIPANPKLVIGLDDSLGDERDAVRTALQSALMANNVNRIETVDVNPAEPTPLDYILGRMTEVVAEQLQTTGETDLPHLGTVGLFSPALTPRIHTFGRINEEAIAAVNRLRPDFRLLLVQQLLQAITSTRSNLQVQGEIFDEQNHVSVPIASRTASDSAIASVTADSVFRTGENIYVRIDNQEDRAMYLSCLAIDDFGDLITLYPADWEAPEEASRIDANRSLTVPRPQDEVLFRLGEAGTVQLLTLVSTTPLRNVLRGLEAMAQSRGESHSFMRLRDDEPLDMLSGLLGDMDDLSRSGDRNTRSIDVVSANDQEPVDTDVLVAFSTLIEIREA